MKIKPLFVVCCRLIVGFLFIFSGFIKANDPLGFAYKLEDYFAVFQLQFLNEYALLFSISICVLEIVLGVAVIIGSHIKITSWSLLLLIIFFTWLTGFSAITNSVTDCGCFGDAIKLTPWQSFYKDLVLLALILVIFIKRGTIFPLLSSMVNNVVVLVFLIGSITFTLNCFYHLPLIDFRPYKIGNNILELMKIPEDAPQDIYDIKFYYKNTSTSEVKEFASNSLPSDTMWKFQDRKEILLQEGYKPPIHDFAIMNAEGHNLTEEFLSNPNQNFILISYDINAMNLTQIGILKKLIDECRNRNIMFIALTASSSEDIEMLKQKTGIDMDFYFCDATALKTVIRSNPGLLLLKNGIVKNNWHYNDFPDIGELKADNILSSQ